MNVTPQKRDPLSWSSTVLPRASEGDVQAIRDTLLLAAAEIRAGRPIVEPELAEFIADGLALLGKGESDPFGAARRRGERTSLGSRWLLMRDIEIARFVISRPEGVNELDAIAQAAELCGVTESVAKKALQTHREFVRDVLPQHPAYATPIDLKAFRDGAQAAE